MYVCMYVCMCVCVCMYIYVCYFVHVTANRMSQIGSQYASSSLDHVHSPTYEVSLCELSLCVSVPIMGHD